MITRGAYLNFLVKQFTQVTGSYASGSFKLLIICSIAPHHPDFCMSYQYSPLLYGLTIACFLWAAMLAITLYYTFPQLMQVTSRFHSLVALGLSGSDNKQFSKYSQSQCSSCGLFWRRCPCPHALLSRRCLKKTSGHSGFENKVISRKIPRRVSLGKKGKEKAKEYCSLTKPSCPPT